MCFWGCTVSLLQTVTTGTKTRSFANGESAWTVLWGSALLIYCGSAAVMPEVGEAMEEVTDNHEYKATGQILILKAVTLERNLKQRL